MLVTTPRPPGIPPGLPSGSGPSSEFSQFPLPNELPPQLPPAASLAPLPGVPSTINLRPLREQDRLLPVSNVFHLVSSQLPANVKVSKDAKIFMQEVISEFIGFVTSEANDVCLFNKQKAISGADIITALQNLDLAMFVAPLEAARKLLAPNARYTAVPRERLPPPLNNFMEGIQSILSTEQQQIAANVCFMPPAPSNSALIPEVIGNAIGSQTLKRKPCEREQQDQSCSSDGSFRKAPQWLGDFKME
ncbi:MAG: hypothetical protein SGPRY_004020 [Prymnesium sp.]